MRKAFLGGLLVTLLIISAGCSSMIPLRVTDAGTIFPDNDWRRQLQVELASMKVYAVWWDAYEMTLYGSPRSKWVADQLRTEQGWTAKAVQAARLIDRTLTDNDVRAYRVYVHTYNDDADSKQTLRGQWSEEFIYMMVGARGNTQSVASLPRDHDEELMVTISMPSS